MTIIEDLKYKTTVINVPEAVGVFEKFEDFQPEFHSATTALCSRFCGPLLLCILQPHKWRYQWRSYQISW